MEQHTVKEIQLSINGDLVSIMTKVLWKGTSENMYSHTIRKTLVKCETIIADATGAIKATIWENMIPNLKDVPTCSKKFKLSYFNKFVNGIRESMLKDIDVDIEIPEEVRAAAEHRKPKEKECSTFIGRVLGVDVLFVFICFNCKT